MKRLKQLLAWLRHEPVMVGYVLDAGITELAQRGFHLSASEVGMVFSAASLLLGFAVRSRVFPLAPRAPLAP